MILVLTVLPALLVLFDRIITSNEWDRLQKYLKRRHEKRKAPDKGRNRYHCQQGVRIETD